MTKHILVAYDGSAPAERAFDFALTLARALEADVYVLAVARPPEPPEEVETEAVLESATEHFEQQFATLRQRVSGTGLSARFEVAVAILQSRSSTRRRGSASTTLSWVIGATLFFSAGCWARSASRSSTMLLAPSRSFGRHVD